MPADTTPQQPSMMPNPTTEERLQRITLLYACLTEINQAMVRSTTREDLLAAVCRTFADKTGMLGGLIYPWHGPAISTGIGPTFLARLQDRNDEAYLSLVARVHAGQNLVCNDVASQPPHVIWLELLLPLGCHALAAYPLRQGKEVVAAMVVFSSQAGWFDQQMCELLESLAVDIAFCLDNLDKEASREAAETELRRSRSKLERAEAIAHVGYWERRLDGFVDWSDETYRIFGLEPQTRPVAVEHLLHMVHPDDQEKVRQAYNQCFSQGLPYDVEYRVLRPDGSLRHLHSQGGCDRDTPEGPTIFGAVLDITEHREALEALRKSEESLAMAVDAAGLGLWDTRLGEPGVSVNSQFARMLGYNPEEFAQLDHARMKSLVHPDDVDGLILAIKSHMAGKSPYFEVECRLCHKEGHWVWALGRGRVTERDEAGQPSRLSGTQIDITDNKQSDDLLRLLYRAVEQSPASIVITDIDGNIEYVNLRFTEVTGYNREEALGQNPRIIKSGHTPIPIYEDLWSTIKTGGTWSGRLENRKKNGDFYWESAIIQGICNEQDEVVNFLAIKEDITERIEAERKIRELTANLEKRIEDRTRAMAQAVKDLESFSYSVSHDLRAPLRAITGFSQILLETEAENLSDEGRGLLDRVVINGKRMANLIDDILEYSRAGRGEPRLTELDLSRMARDIACDLSNDYPRALVAVADLPSAKGDTTMVRQVLTNLISNAMKFTVKVTDPLVEVGWFEQDGKIVYFVRDNGAGFDMQYSNHLFGMFQRLHSGKEFPGTGVGLAIVKRLVERHGGRIWAEAKIDEGATFNFTLG